MSATWVRILIATVSISLAVAACRPASDDTGDDDDDDGTTSGTPTPTPTPAIDVQSTAISIAAASEQIQCFYTSLPSASPLDIGEISSTLTSGIASVQVYRTTAAAQPDGTLGICSFGSETPVFVYAAHDATSSLAFPTDTGISLAANQPLVLKIHYANATVDPIDDAQVTVSLQPAAPVSQKVGTLFAFNSNINIQPGAVGDEETAVCEPPAGAQIFRMTTDSRKLTTSARLYRNAGSTGDLLLETLDWENPTVGLYTPALMFTTGEGIQYTCTYNNPGAGAVTSGDSVSDETCSAMAYFTGATVNTICVNSIEITQPL